MSRLVDADALMKSWLEKPDPTMGNEREKAIVAELASQVIDAINEAPTIEAEPVRHGKWEVAGNTTHYYICSVYGWLWLVKGVNNASYNVRYAKATEE